MCVCVCVCVYVCESVVSVLGVVGLFHMCVLLNDLLITVLIQFSHVCASVCLCV